MCSKPAQGRVFCFSMIQAVKYRFPTFKVSSDYMPFNRNFTYWIDKRKWKYYFLIIAIELEKQAAY